MVQKKLLFMMVLTGMLVVTEAKENVCLRKSLEYLETLTLTPEKADYKDTYLLLPVIMRRYNLNFPVSDSILNEKFILKQKMFCLDKDCFNNFKPDKKYFKKITRRWKEEPENIDVRMYVSTNYGLLKNPPSLKELFACTNKNLYELTHAGVFLYIIEQQVGESDDILYWKKNILKEVESVIKNRDWMFDPVYKSVNLDVLLECFLIVALYDKLSDTHLNEIINYQLTDGGYPLNLQSCAGSTHSSLIAVWLLMAHMNNKTP